MPDNVYIPETDFLSPQGIVDNIPDEDYELENLDDLQVADKPDTQDTQDNQAEGISEPQEGISEPQEDTEDLTYDREDTTSDIGNSLSYANNPVQMQFGEELGLQYPCIYVKSSQAGLEKHKLMALQNIVKANNTESRLPLYLDVEGSLMKLGSVDSKSLKTLLSNKLFASWGITIKADCDTEYDGDMRLAYCSI